MWKSYVCVDKKHTGNFVETVFAKVLSEWGGVVRKSTLDELQERRPDVLQWDQIILQGQWASDLLMILFYPSNWVIHFC